MKKAVYLLLCSLFAGLSFLHAATKIAYPDWVLSPPHNEQEIYVVGISTSKNKQLGITSAASLARAELSRIVSVRVINQLMNSFSQKGTGETADFSAISHSVSAQISETVVKGAKIDRIYEDKTTSPPTYYVLTVLSKEDLKSSFSTLTDDKKFQLFAEPKMFDSTVEMIDTEIPPVKDSSVKTTPLSAKTVPTEIEPRTGREPGWIKKIPVTKEYYTGIGQASSLRGAQDGAIAMIVSQIKAKVHAELETFTKETNGKTEDTFNQMIRLSLLADVEDLEFVDAYNAGDKGFFAYYRLDVAQYQAKQQAKENAAKEKALDLLAKSDLEKDPALSLKQVLLGYYTMAPYITKLIQAEYKGAKVILVNELTARIQQKLQMISISSPKTVYDADLIGFAPFNVPFLVNANGVPVKYLPFTFITTNGDLSITSRVLSETDGSLQCIINGPGNGAGLKSFKIIPDLLSFIKDAADEESAYLYLGLITNLGVPTKEVSVNVKLPVFSIKKISNGSIKIYDEKANVLLSAFKNDFEEKTGAVFTDKNAKLQFRITIDANTALSDMSGQYFTRMTVTIALIDTLTNIELFSATTPQFKGGSTTEEKSVQKVVERYLASYNADLINELLNFFNSGKN